MGKFLTDDFEGNVTKGAKGLKEKYPKLSDAEAHDYARAVVLGIINRQYDDTLRALLASRGEY